MVVASSSGKFPAHDAVEIADRHRAFDGDRAVGIPPHAESDRIVLVLDVADDLLENIFQRDEAHDHAIFVDDQREMGLALAGRPATGLADVVVFGHVPGVERDILDLEMRDVAARRLDRAQEILGVQYADDIVRLAAPDRHPRIGRIDHLADEFMRRQIGIDRVHFGPVNHHVLDDEFAQLEQAAEHVAFGALHAAFPVQEIDGALQFLVAGEQRMLDRHVDAEELQQALHEGFDGDENRAEDGDEEADRAARR